MNIIKIVWQTARTITNEILAGRVLLYLFIYFFFFPQVFWRQQYLITCSPSLIQVLIKHLNIIAARDLHVYIPYNNYYQENKSQASKSQKNYTIDKKIIIITNKMNKAISIWPLCGLAKPFTFQIVMEAIQIQNN